MRQEDFNKLQALKEKLNNEMTQDEVEIYDKIEKGLNKINYNYNKSNSNKYLDWKNREYKRGEVFYADLSGNIGSEQGNGENGLRPVVIIQNNIGNKHSPTVIVAAITSVLTKSKLPTHVEMMSEEYNLPKNSIALFEQVRTLDKRRLKDKICYLGDDMQKKLDNAVIISMTNPTPKTLLEKLPTEMRRHIINTLKEIKKKEITIQEMRQEGYDKSFVKKMFDKKITILKQFIIYCRNHQLNYEDFYILNKGINEEIKSELIAL